MARCTWTGIFGSPPRVKFASVTTELFFVMKSSVKMCWSVRTRRCHQESAVLCVPIEHVILTPLLVRMLSCFLFWKERQPSLMILKFLMVFPWWKFKSENSRYLAVISHLGLHLSWLWKPFSSGYESDVRPNGFREGWSEFHLDVSRRLKSIFLLWFVWNCKINILR